MLGQVVPRVNLLCDESCLVNDNCFGLSALRMADGRLYLGRQVQYIKLELTFGVGTWSTWQTALPT